MKMIRFVLGKIILFLDSVFTPESKKRTADEQAATDAQTRSLTLYQLRACPFCVKVRREMKRLGLSITLRNVDEDASAQQELMAGGKIDQVPCLRIEEPGQPVRWMYESGDINAYLQQRFA